MASVIGGLSGVGGIVLPYVAKGFEYIKEAGKVVIPMGVNIAKVFADPKKGFFISLAGYYALSIINFNPEDVANQIESVAVMVDNWDPVSAYEGWVRSVTGLGSEPPYQLFNPAIAWGEVENIEMLKYRECGWGDIGCWIENGLKTIAKVLLSGVFYIKNIILGIGYYFLSGLVVVAKFIASGFLRYVLKPISSAIVWFFGRVRDFLRMIFCYYIKLSPVIAFGEEIVSGKGSLGKKLLRAFAKMFGLTLISSLIARECSLVPMVEPGQETVTVPEITLPKYPITESYNVSCMISLRCLEQVVIPPKYVLGASLMLEYSETFTAVLRTPSPETPHEFGGSISLTASESLNYIIESGLSGSISLTASESITANVLPQVDGRMGLSASETFQASIVYRPPPPLPPE